MKGLISMPGKVSNLEFGRKIKELRHKYNFSLRQVSSQSKTTSQPAVSPSYWSLIERGERNIPKPDTLKRMAKGLRISTSEILELAGYSKNDDEKVVDLKDDDVLVTYGGKPISDDYMDIFRKILQDYDEVHGNK